jgi:hypothetical protein
MSKSKKMPRRQPTAKEESELRTIIRQYGDDVVNHKENFHLICTCGCASCYPAICASLVGPLRFVDLGQQVLAKIRAERDAARAIAA